MLSLAATDPATLPLPSGEPLALLPLPPPPARNPSGDTKSGDEPIVVPTCLDFEAELPNGVLPNGVPKGGRIAATPGVTLPDRFTFAAELDAPGDVIAVDDPPPPKPAQPLAIVDDPADEGVG